MAFFHLNSGVPTKLFDAVSPSASLTSDAIGIPKTRFGDGGRRLTWRTGFAGAPSSVSIELQGAFRDVNAEFAVLDTSTATTGEYRVLIVHMPIIRVKIASYSGGSGYTVEVLV